MPVVIFPRSLLNSLQGSQPDGFHTALLWSSHPVPLFFHTYASLSLPHLLNFAQQQSGHLCLRVRPRTFCHLSKTQQEEILWALTLHCLPIKAIPIFAFGSMKPGRSSDGPPRGKMQTRLLGNQRNQGIWGQAESGSNFKFTSGSSTVKRVISRSS